MQHPVWLWGIASILIPLLIHLWHQQKGKSLDWAAMQWLSEKNQQQHRGLRLDNWVLLVLRCLLLILLSLLLAKPLWNGLAPKSQHHTVHLVQPSAHLVSNFRFELEKARQKGEDLYWIAPGTPPVTDLMNIPAQVIVQPADIQSSINSLHLSKTNFLQVYISNTSRLAQVPSITIPTAFELHTVADSSVIGHSVLAFSNGKQVGINADNELDSQLSNGKVVHEGPLRVHLDFQNKVAQKTVEAALAALREVYKLDLTDAKQSVYDWVLTDQPVLSPNPKTLYTVSGIGTSLKPNVQITREVLTPQTSDLVASGQLPEWLGEQLVSYYQLDTRQLPLTSHMLAGLFKQRPNEQHTETENGYRFLLLGFLALVLAERWLALTKNA
ncbi:MAG: BatA domain-containing protein [Siphonobacter sp.]